MAIYYKSLHHFLNFSHKMLLHHTLKHFLIPIGSELKGASFCSFCEIFQKLLKRNVIMSQNFFFEQVYHLHKIAKQIKFIINLTNQVTSAIIQEKFPKKIIVTFFHL